MAERYLCFPRGIIRGALHNLGIETKVTSTIAFNGNALACTSCLCEAREALFYKLDLTSLFLLQ